MAELNIKFELDTQSPEVVAAKLALDKALENYKNALSNSFKVVKEEPKVKDSHSKCGKINCPCGVQPNGDVIYCNPFAAKNHLDNLDKAGRITFYRNLGFGF